MDVLTTLFPANILYSKIMPYVKGELAFSVKDLRDTYTEIKSKRIISNIVRHIFFKTGYLCSRKDERLRIFAKQYIENSQKWNSISMYGYKKYKNELFFVTSDKTEIRISYKSLIPSQGISHPSQNLPPLSKSSSV
jgi:hypothetical protein